MMRGAPIYPERLNSAPTIARAGANLGVAHHLRRVPIMRLLAIAPTSSSQTINVDVIVPYGRGRASFFLHTTTTTTTLDVLHVL